jgi:hypothetical protein
MGNQRPARSAIFCAPPVLERAQQQRNNKGGSNGDFSFFFK